MRYLIVLLTILQTFLSYSNVDYYDIKDTNDLNLYVHMSTDAYLNDEKISMFKQLVQKTDTLRNEVKVNLIYLQDFSFKPERRIDVFYGEQSAVIQGGHWKDTVNGDGIWIIYRDVSFDLKVIKNVFFNLIENLELITSAETEDVIDDNSHDGHPITYRRSIIDQKILLQEYEINLNIKQKISHQYTATFNGEEFQIRFGYKVDGLNVSDIYEFRRVKGNEIIFINDSTFYIYSFDDIQKGPFVLKGVHKRWRFNDEKYLTYLPNPDRIIFNVYNYMEYAFSSAYLVKENILVHDIHRHDSIFFRSLIDGRFEERIVNYQEVKEEPLFGLKEILYLIIGVVVGAGAILILRRKK